MEFSTKSWWFLIVSYHLGTMDGMETQAMVADTVQELVELLTSLPPAESEAENIDRLQQLEGQGRSLRVSSPVLSGVSGQGSEVCRRGQEAEAERGGDGRRGMGPLGCGVGDRAALRP